MSNKYTNTIDKTTLKDTNQIETISNFLIGKPVAIKALYDDYYFFCKQVKLINIDLNVFEKKLFKLLQKVNNSYSIKTVFMNGKKVPKYIQYIFNQNICNQET